MDRIDDEIASLKGLPTSMKFVLLGALALTAFSAATAFLLIFASGYKLDPGLATFTGAIIGLTVVGWQTNKGFKNLVRSQKNQAELDREARLHRAQLDREIDSEKRQHDRSVLLSAMWAEITTLWHLVAEAER